ncbi:hypothetical protein C8035_v001674 [Colletotrichum spinosum]|uniref:Uncharacterized protein n=1 Tax=Colletotrichum spinosum TaxID=1347390 RepID=A0A4R8QCL2_9PEZI|nr:hypothetical protein C8035_v001674 [Colletotrichum spinosum]
MKSGRLHTPPRSVASLAALWDNILSSSFRSGLSSRILVEPKHGERKKPAEEFADASQEDLESAVGLRQREGSPAGLGHGNFGRDCWETACTDTRSPQSGAEIPSCHSQRSRLRSLNRPNSQERLGHSNRRQLNLSRHAAVKCFHRRMARSVAQHQLFDPQAPT